MRYFWVPLSLLWAASLSSAFAEERYIVFDLRGTLIQGVPKANLEKIEKSEVIEIDGKSFRIADRARAALAALSELPNVKLAIFSTDTKDFTEKALNAILLPGAASRPLKGVVHKVLSQEDLTTISKDELPTEGKSSLKYRKDLSKINSDLSRVVLIDDDDNIVPDDQKMSLLNVGPSYYHFEKFEEVSAGAAALQKANKDDYEKKKHRFPVSETEWKRDRDKVVGALGILVQSNRDARRDSSKSFSAWSSEKSNADRKPFVDLGHHILNISYRWRYSPTVPRSILGCEEIDIKDSSYSQIAPTDECRKRIPYQYSWGGTPARDCGIITPEGVWIEGRPLNECISNLKTNFFWVSSELNQCGRFTADKILIEYVDKEKCMEGPVKICDIKTGIFSEQNKFFINGVLSDIIPQILALGDGAVIPADIIEKYDPRVIGLSIVRRIHEKRDAKDQVSFVDFFKEGEIQMAFDDQYTDSIEEKCFQNQHQNNHTHGCHCQTQRANAEDGFASLTLEASYTSRHDAKIHKVRPVYSYFGVPHGKGSANISYSDNYGNVIAVMGDAVKDRTTFTPNDSLGMSADEVRSLRHKSRSRMNSGASYFEAQIWGGACFSDVKYFMVNCPYLGSGNRTDQGYLRRLSKVGKPIYQCDGSGREMVPGKLLFPGSSEK